MDCDSFSFPYRCPERYSTGELPWVRISFVIDHDS